MKFGFGFVPKMPLVESLDVVRRGEELGFDMLWIPDQSFYRDPFLVMGAWAQATSSIEFMIGVTNPYTRHPAQVARAMATLDEITSGRANLGIGAGNRRELLLPMGYEQTAAAARCRDMAVIVRELLKGETTHYRSDYFVADDIRLEWTPPRADLPIYIAGRGGLLLEGAGEVADGAVVGAVVSPTGLDFAFGAIERGAAKAGRSMNGIKVVSWVTMRVVDDIDPIKERLKTSVAHIIGGAPDNLLTALGLEPEYVSTLKTSYFQGGQTAAAQYVTDREIDMLTVVGDAETVRAKVKRLAERGVDQIGLLLTEPTTEANIAVIERIARDVIPYFR
ncbi:MAG TPA: LLM class flavin-dependent oxidoreductase [Phototrophicaceae bacterium]|nr:LLM class flavin-dependent oxidoreductase [Phototrophicaceae bacterium]